MECGSFYMMYFGGKGLVGLVWELLCSGKIEKENWVQGQGFVGLVGVGFGGSWYLFVVGCRVLRYLGILFVVEVRLEFGFFWCQRCCSLGCRWMMIGMVVGDVLF